jgi:hypothetical protein
MSLHRLEQNLAWLALAGGKSPPQFLQIRKDETDSRNPFYLYISSNRITQGYFAGLQ